jgi:radical SAM protein with 4Fe4S-binding SPASM domain
MPPGLALRLVREFAAMGGREITFTGGEPFVYPDLPRLLSDARSVGLETAVFSSGIVHNDAGCCALPLATLQTLAESIGCVVFSVYGVDSAVHDRITHLPGSLHLTHEAIRRAASVGIPVELHFVPTRINYRDLPALIVEAQALGAQAIRVIRYVPHGRGSTNQDALRLAVQDQLDLRRILRDVVVADGVKVRVGSGFGYLLDEAPACTAAVDEVVIAADGRVYPCSGFADFHGDGAVGSVLHSPLREVWNDAPYLQRVRAILAARLSGASGCSGGCPAQKAFASGQLSDITPDPDASALGSLAADSANSLSKLAIPA